MKKCVIQLLSIKDVRQFVDAVTKYDVEIDLSSGRYVVDAKSIMGIFSLDLLQPIGVTIHTDDCEEILKDLDKFIVK
ncbi:MAG: HPr family phosphocarrier protein [Clostridia bacterium]|nr:HPr family phosphocarrier protein [Clostridia bacterium]